MLSFTFKPAVWDSFSIERNWLSVPKDPLPLFFPFLVSPSVCLSCDFLVALFCHENHLLLGPSVLWPFSVLCLVGNSFFLSSCSNKWLKKNNNWLPPFNSEEFLLPVLQSWSVRLSWGACFWRCSFFLRNDFFSWNCLGPGFIASQIDPRPCYTDFFFLLNLYFCTSNAFILPLLLNFPFPSCDLTSQYELYWVSYLPYCTNSVTLW